MRRLLCPLVPAVLASCGFYYSEIEADAGALPDPAAARAPRFRSLADAALHGRFALHPVEASALGIRDHDARLDDLRPEALGARTEALRKHLFRLGALDPATLEGADRIDALLLEGRLRADLSRIEIEHLASRSPWLYLDLVEEGIETLLVPVGIPLDRRLSALAGRFDQVPAFLAAGLGHLKALPVGLAQEVVDETRALAEFLKAGFAARLPQVGDAGLRRSVDEARVRAVEALEAFAAALSKLPAVSRPGIGEAALATRLRHEEGIEAAPSDLLRIEQAAMQSLRAELQGLPASPAPGTAGDGDFVRALAERLPGVLVLPAPAFQSFRSRTRLRVPGLFEPGATRAVLSVSVQAASRADLDVLAASIRAGLELAGARRAAPTPIRKAFASRAAMDGWELYGELRSVEEGKGEMARIRIDRALLASARAAAAIRIHAAGSSVAEAAALLQKEAGLGPADAAFEARRVASDPGLLLGSWGLREILALRADWRAKTGGSIRDFDEAFLGIGPLPLPLARRQLLEAP